MASNGKTTSGSGTGSNGNGESNGDGKPDTAAPEIDYTDSGWVISSRKWLGRELARRPGAFVVYFHLVGWANHDNGKLRRGQLALGERHFGALVGMSVTTVRKWLRWLRDNGWIELRPVRWGRERGTIVTVLRYVEGQNFNAYKIPSEQQEALLTPRPPGSPPAANEYLNTFLRVTGNRPPELPA